VAALALLLAACTPASGLPATSLTVDSPPGRSAHGEGRTLVLALRSEPRTLAGTILVSAGGTTATQRRLFNAGLTYADGADRRHAYLARELPRLNSESWQILPDGRMETIYRLRPGLAWHDGTALSASDFVLAWRVYSTADLGIAASPPQALMEEVTAPDEGTVVIRWRRSFPEAGALEGYGGSEAAIFTPLPRHLIERAYEAGRDSFMNQPFWTTDYVGLGPYSVDRWEPGAFIEALAFDRHALGRPRIERLRLVFIGDPNAVLANLLAGEVHVPIDDSIRIQQGLILRQEWSASGGRGAGSVEFGPTTWRWVQVQHRPEYANPKAILDLRVRRALAHAIDKQTINDALFAGHAILSDSVIPPTKEYFPTIDRAVAKYAYDPRRTDQLMAEAGFTREREGDWSGSEGRLNLELLVIASAQNDAERSILADGWRRAGFQMEEGAFPPGGGQDPPRTTFRSLSTQSGSFGASAILSYTSAAISGPETRWVGRNKGGWSNPEFDRFAEAFQTTVEASARIQHLAQAVRVLSEDLGVFPLYFNPGVLAYPSGLSGIDVTDPEADVSWNVHEWEFR
jgi:peptide/nickel transport system substrate-binding protein